MKTVFSLLMMTAAFFITTTSVKAQGYYHAPACQPTYYGNNYGNGYGNNYGRDHVDYDQYRIAKDRERMHRDMFFGNVFALHQDHRDMQNARRDMYNREDRGRYNNRW